MVYHEKVRLISRFVICRQLCIVCPQTGPRNPRLHTCGLFGGEPPERSGTHKPGVRCLPVHLPDGYARVGRAGFRPAAGCRRRLCHAVRLPEAGRQDGARALHDRKGACRRGQDTVVLRRAAGVPSPAGESGSDPQVCRVYGAPGRKERLRRHRHGLGDHAGQGVACPHDGPAARTVRRTLGTHRALLLPDHGPQHRPRVRSGAGRQAGRGGRLDKYHVL